jgi:hypothetical protein
MCGDIEGVWIEPVTAQEIITFLDRATLFLPRLASRFGRVIEQRFNSG